MDIQTNKNREGLILSQYKSGLTLQKIGYEFNISRERVRQIVGKALATEIGKPEKVSQNLLIAIEKKKHIRRRLVKDWGLKSYKFKKAIGGRLKKINYQFSRLASYANRNIYDYNERDIDRVFFEIERMAKETKAKFHFPKNTKEFKL